MFINSLVLTIISIICLNTTSFSNEKEPSVKVKYLKNTISLNEPFTIQIFYENDKLSSVSNFPEIEDFIKKNTSFEKDSNKYVITQTYIPIRDGNFSLNNFQIYINNKKYHIMGTSIHVLKKKNKNIKKQESASLENFSSGKPDVFFSITKSKSKVFVSEGVQMEVAFYINETNRAEFNFVNLQNQLDTIIKNLRGSKHWVEEITNQKNIKIDKVKVRNSIYTRYLFYSAVIFPMELKDISIPSQSFKILTYKIRRTNPKLIERDEDFLTLRSKPININVIPLPDHELKDKVPVGEYFMETHVSSHLPRAGKEFTFILTINSHLGFSSIPHPIVKENEIFDIFTPKVRSVQKKDKKGDVLYQVIFEYPLIANKPGHYKLDSLFEWSFFNSKISKYQTLKPALYIEVMPWNGDTTDKNDESDHTFYDDMINKASNTIKNKEREDQIKLISNISILLMLIFTVILIFKK